MKSNKLDRIFDRLESAHKREQLNASLQTIPSHIWLAGYKSLGENSARVILGSTESITPDQVVKAVPNLTDGKMTAYIASFTNINCSGKIGDANIHYASVFAIKPKLTYQKATDDVLSNYKMLSNTEYLDTTLQKVWERKEINGESYLFRVNELNPEDILKTTLMAKTESTYKVNSDNFILSHDAKVGDYVEFFAMAPSADDKDTLVPFMDVAEVVANRGDCLDITVKEGEFVANATIPAHAVRTVAKSNDDKPLTRQQVMDFLYRCYGDKYKEIIEKTGGFGVNKDGKV